MNEIQIIVVVANFLPETRESKKKGLISQNIFCGINQWLFVVAVAVENIKKNEESKREESKEGSRYRW